MGESSFPQEARRPSLFLPGQFPTLTLAAARCGASGNQRRRGDDLSPKRSPTVPNAYGAGSQGTGINKGDLGFALVGAHTLMV